MLFASRIIQFILIIAVYAPAAHRRHNWRRQRKDEVRFRYDARRTTPSLYTKTMCMDMGSTLRARHKTCFLRPDTGPCRADIIQWYYDAKQKKCFRFFWGGCQGNGNKFETELECHNYCYLDRNITPAIPHFCSLAFDFGTCFGYYHRWGWDRFEKSCKRRIYSGCGGNQNNFETQEECLKSCLTPPKNSIQGFQSMTTCFPIDIDDLKS